MPAILEQLSIFICYGSGDVISAIHLSLFRSVPNITLVPLFKHSISNPVSPAYVQRFAVRVDICPRITPRIIRGYLPVTKYPTSGGIQDFLDSKIRNLCKK
jgi:hypothetical protein